MAFFLILFSLTWSISRLLTQTPFVWRLQDESAKKPDIKLNIPEMLKVMLVDDWEAVTKNNQVTHTITKNPLPFAIAWMYA